MPGLAVVLAMCAAAILAPVVAPHAIDDRFPGLLDAPPTRPHVQDGEGWHAPFIYRWRVINQLEQRYEEDRSNRVPLTWFSKGRLATSTRDADAPAKSTWSRRSEMPAEAGWRRGAWAAAPE